MVHDVSWALGVVWTSAENLIPTGIRSLNCRACSESPYRLSYRGLLLIWVTVNCPRKILCCGINWSVCQPCDDESVLTSKLVWAAIQEDSVFLLQVADIISCLLQDFNFAECCSRVIVRQQHAQVLERNVQSLSSVSLPYPAFAAATDFTQYRCLTYALMGNIKHILYTEVCTYRSFILSCALGSQG